jgi:hypothetical protein
MVKTLSIHAMAVFMRRNFALLIAIKRTFDQSRGGRNFGFHLLVYLLQ